MDGDYIPDMVKALEEGGISDVQAVDRNKWSGGTGLDAVAGVFGLRDEMPNFPVKLDNDGDGSGQFNLVGYSFGSLAAAQVALQYAREGGTVDNLVLIGSPISEKFLKTLQGTAGIKNVIVKDLTSRGDPIFAGMSGARLLVNTPKLASQMPDGTGHFYYAPNTAAGMTRRRELAKELFQAGLR